MMNRWIKIMLCLILCMVMGVMCAAADSGVTILNAPKKIDLYRSGENVFYSGSIRYKLAQNTKVLKHSITEYQEAAGFEMQLFEEGDRVYRVDLRGEFDHLELEHYGLPDVLPFTFAIETNKGTENATFSVHMHADPWDARRVEMSGFDRDELCVGDVFELVKPTLDGETVRTGLLNDEENGRAHHHPDPYFGNGWVNDFTYTPDTLELVNETGSAFVMKVIAPGKAETIYTVREINSNRQLSVVNVNQIARASDPDDINVRFSPEGGRKNNEVRVVLGETASVGNRLIILAEGIGEFGDVLDEQDLSCKASIRDKTIASGLEYTYRSSASRPAVVFEYTLSDFKKAGVTQLDVELTYKGQKDTVVIPIIVCEGSADNMPYVPKVSFDFPKVWYPGDVPSFHISGDDADEYEWSIDCMALGIRGATKNAGIYRVYADLWSEEKGSYRMDLGEVVVKARGAADPVNDHLFLDETWSNFNIAIAYCSEIDSALELEMGAYGRCLSGAQEHHPKLTCELVGVPADCPYDIEIRESYLHENEISPCVWVTMTPKTMPLKAGRYAYEVKYTVTCCGQTTSISQRVPLFVVDVPKNKLNYLHTPPAYMCLDRDQVLWDEDILTPVNRYCSLELIFESGAEVWEEEYYQRFRLYRPIEEGMASWKYVGHYANGDVVLHSGEMMIFPRDEYGKLGNNTHLTAVRNSFDLTPKQRHVPRLFPADSDWASEWFLKAQLIDVDADNAVCYELTLVDEYENEVKLPESTTLYLPYPDGMTEEEAANNEFVVVHEADEGAVLYSTQEDTLTKTEYGLEMVVDSLSPFTVNWGTEEEMLALVAAYADTSSLPKTGDESQMALWLLLTAVGAIGLTAMAKRKIA